MEARKFKDLTGASWSLLISTPDLKRVKAEVPGVDLLELDGAVFTKILQDPAVLVDTLAVLLMDQIRRAKPTAEEIALRMVEMDAEAERDGRTLTPADRAAAALPGLSPIEFARRLGGDVLDEASTALLRTVIDFFPSRRRGPLNAALTKTNALMDRAAEHGTKLIESDQMDDALTDLLGQMDQDFASGLRAMRGRTSTGSPASSESTPTG